MRHRPGRIDVRYFIVSTKQRVALAGFRSRLRVVQTARRCASQSVKVGQIDQRVPRYRGRSGLPATRSCWGDRLVGLRGARLDAQVLRSAALSLRYAVLRAVRSSALRRRRHPGVRSTSAGSGEAAAVRCFAQGCRGSDRPAMAGMVSTARVSLSSASAATNRRGGRRSSAHCSRRARGVGIGVLHAGDDPASARALDEHCRAERARFGRFW